MTYSDVLNVNQTKRNVLKAIASIYDPVGYIQPLVIKLKLMFQEICSLHIGWDDYIGKELEKKWTVIVKEVENFNEIAIPRCYFIRDVNNPIIKHYLHGFSDSSMAAYAACVYIKRVSRSNKINIHLVAAKSRLVPLKKSIPCPVLNFLGIFILSKLMVVIHEALITLSWVKARNLEFKPFVENRLCMIRRNVPPSQ